MPHSWSSKRVPSQVPLQTFGRSSGEAGVTGCVVIAYFRKTGNISRQAEFSQSRVDGGTRFNTTEASHDLASESEQADTKQALSRHFHITPSARSVPLQCACLSDYRRPRCVRYILPRILTSPTLSILSPRFDKLTRVISPHTTISSADNWTTYADSFTMTIRVSGGEAANLGIP